MLDEYAATIALTIVVGGALLFAATLRTREAAHVAKTLGGCRPRKIHSLGTRIPFIGDFLEITRQTHRKHDWMVEQCLRFHGEPWQANPGMPAFVMLTSPEAVEEVTTTQFDYFAKGPFQISVLNDLLGNGVFASDGEQWYHQRKTAAKFFSAKSLRECMANTMQRNMERVHSVLSRARPDDELVDLSHLFHQFTLQTFTEGGLGVEMEVIGSKQMHPFEDAVDTAMPIISRRGRLPPFVWKLERWLSVGQEKQLADSMRVARRWLSSMIEASIRAMERQHGNQQHRNDNDNVKSVVQLFVDHTREDMAGLQATNLVDFLLNFVIAARDTSALTLCWFFFALRQNPAVEKRIRREMAEKIALNTTYLTADDAKKLVYLEATMKETLRLYPAGPNTVKYVVRDTVICDIFLREGQMISLSAYVLARNPRVWGHDAAEFKPERWIGASGELILAPASEFFTFHAWPRSCLGMSLAMLTLRVVTANLLHRYDIEVDPANDGSYVNSPALAMMHPLLAKVRPRGV